MKIRFKDGLLLTSVRISFRGSVRVVENIAIDTGATRTMISPDAVEDIGIFAEIEDSVRSFCGVGGSLHSCFSKDVELIQIGEAKLGEIKLDFGVVDPRRDINGLLGLDILMKLGAIIDIKRLSLTFDVM